MLNILSENSTTLLVFVATALSIWYVITLLSKRNLPPGPLSLPVIGSMYLLWKPGVTLMALFAELTKKYGKVFTIQMGPTPIILINDLKFVQEAYVKKGDITSNRPYIYYFLKKMEKQAGLGLSLSSGQQWKEIRRLCTMAMRECGLGKKSLEEKIYEEVTELLRVIDQSKGKPVDLKPTLMQVTSNVVSSIIFGSRFDFEDPKFKLLLQRLREGTKVNVFFMPVNFFPFLRFFTNKEDKFIKTVQTTSAHIKDLLADHEQTFDPDNIRDLVDLVLKMRQISPESRHFSDINIRRAVVDLFGAGSETTAATFQFLLYVMANNPAIQERCQREIDQAFGPSQGKGNSGGLELLTTTEASLQSDLWRDSLPAEYFIAPL
ncbi:cytochrome p450 2j6 [Plakobranchus ocellatus]|uniref:Cytochrome p450 2j6 n=1 Tax=Plakobranchus ocellatus TaxID=259542 RepID=A0AAV4ANJ5_9GAST|nr:cytochrome p450 2j6 [Plakobranchus ocellatus]